MVAAPVRDSLPRHRRDRRSVVTDSEEEGDSEEDRSRRRRAAKKKQKKADSKRRSRKSGKKSRAGDDSDSDTTESDSEASSDSSSSSSEPSGRRSKSKSKSKASSSRKSKKDAKKTSKSRSKKKKHVSSSEDSSSSSSSSSSAAEEMGAAVMGVQSTAVVPVQTNIDALGAEAFGAEASAFPDLIGEAPVADFSNMPGEDPTVPQSSVGSLAGRFPQLGNGGNQQAVVLPGMVPMGMVPNQPLGMMNGTALGGQAAGMSQMGMGVGMGMGMGMNGMGMNGLGMNQPGMNPMGMGMMGTNVGVGSGNLDNLNSDFGNLSTQQGQQVHQGNFMFPGNNGQAF